MEVGVCFGTNKKREQNGDLLWHFNGLQVREAGMSNGVRFSVDITINKKGCRGDGGLMHERDTFVKKFGTANKVGEHIEKTVDGVALRPTYKSATYLSKTK